MLYELIIIHVVFIYLSMYLFIYLLLTNYLNLLWGQLIKLYLNCTMNDCMSISLISKTNEENNLSTFRLWFYSF